jgi:chromatin assembly factor 1 subunit A
MFPLADHLQAVLSSLPPSMDPSCVPMKASHGYKTYHHLAARNILAELSEAEISGDTSLVRSLLTTLSNRNLLPAKVLIFSEDIRPGYFGTWTRSSRIVGPRTPLAKDMVAMDYAYDSGEEWEEEKGDADDVVEDGEDEEAGEEDGDSDLDSWLVDDDEVVEVIEDEMEGYDVFLSPLPPLPAPVKKRKTGDDEDKKLGKKRKVVVPLVPFAKGPFWEKSIGQCEYDSFKPYKIQLFNGRLQSFIVVVTA